MLSSDCKDFSYQTMQRQTPTQPPDIYIVRHIRICMFLCRKEGILLLEVSFHPDINQL